VFVEAIETAAKYTRAIHYISRNYGSTIIQPGTSTLFIVNSEGWALTCGHVADNIAVGRNIVQKAENFKKELDTRKGTIKQNKLLKELEKRYGYSKKDIFELYFHFMDCVDKLSGFQLIRNKKYDVALVRFEGFTQLKCDTFPTFPADTSKLQRGEAICRVGFPFPEFTNYEYDKDSDKIKWNNTGRKGNPLFPIEGMLTRFVSGKQGEIFAFELSTPGLRGQSGGPAFDVDARVWGMQFQTAHLDLDFDVDQEVLRQGIKRQVKDSAFLHVGRCIHVDVLKSFMRENNVSFVEG
jgi:hypothetical protein